MLSEVIPKNKKIILIAISVFAILITIGIERDNSEGEGSKSIIERRTPQNNILFGSNLDDHIDDKDAILEKLNLLSWDLAVSTDTNLSQESRNFLSEVSERNIAKESNLEKVIDSIQIIYLNEKRDCESEPVTRDDLNKYLKREIEYRILFTNCPILTGRPHLSIFDISDNDYKLNTWVEALHKEINGEIDIVISGAENNEVFRLHNVDNVRYVSNSLPPKEMDERLLTFLRISTTDRGLILDRVNFSNSKMIETSYLKDIPKYNVSVDHEQLLKIYRELPMYNFDLSNKKWVTKVENEVVSRKELEGKMNYNKNQYNIEIKTRGSVGNNWGDLKKSWTINFEDEKGPEGQSQLKFIIPDDRHFITQLFVIWLNEQMGVPSPKAHIGRLVINEIDFGLYVVYEDFDKRFIELNRYNSDAAPVNNLFQDERMDFYMWDDLNYIEKPKSEQNKTYEQHSLLIGKIIKGDEPAEMLDTILDRENYLSWVATQIISGDTYHQDAQDNMRFFLDKSTGKLILLSWDQYLVHQRYDDPYGVSGQLQKVIMGNAENRNDVEKKVTEFIGNEEVLYQEYDRLDNQYRVAYLNDPFTPCTEERLNHVIDNFKSVLVGNIERTNEYHSQQ